MLSRCNGNKTIRVFSVFDPFRKEQFRYSVEILHKPSMVRVNRADSSIKDAISVLKPRLVHILEMIKKYGSRVTKERG